MIYLDHAATTPLDGDVLKAMTPYLTEIYGNPSSQHAFGRRAANAVLSARDKIADIMGVPSGSVYFTAGGTESCNTALKGVCAANCEKGRHIVLSAIEHPALISSAEDMKRFGFTVDYVKPDIYGAVKARDIAAAIRPDTVFVGVMSANNETGIIQPVSEIYDVCKQRGVFFYCDCVQTAGVLNFADFPADGIGFSAHKFYGPKGFGGLYMRGNQRFQRLLSGGSQEKGLRGGTTFVAGAVGCARALEKAVESVDYNNKRIAALRDKFVEGALRKVEGTHLNGRGTERLPSNANLSFDGCTGEQIAFALDLNGIAVSTGSACSSGAVTRSHVLEAMGLPDERVKSAVRFTFGKSNTENEVEQTLNTLCGVVESIRKANGKN